MTDDGVEFTENAALRIGRAVRAYESSQGMGGASSSRDYGTSVRCTSSTPDGSGNFPGVVTWSDDGVTYYDLDTVVMRDLNGAALASGTRYECEWTGATAAGDSLFVTGAGGVAAYYVSSNASEVPLVIGTTPYTVGSLTSLPAGLYLLQASVTTLAVGSGHSYGVYLGFLDPLGNPLGQTYYGAELSIGGESVVTTLLSFVGWLAAGTYTVQATSIGAGVTSAKANPVLWTTNPCTMTAILLASPAFGGGGLSGTYP